METVQNAHIGVSSHIISNEPARLAGWASLALLACWILALTGSIITSSVFSGAADAFIPEKIGANVLAASLGWFLQILLGSIMIMLSLPYSDYLAKPGNILVRFALIGGLLGGVFFIAAGAGGQENVFQSVFSTPEQNQAAAEAAGLADLTVINVANNLVAGGMRSTGSYMFGWAMVLWGAAALKSDKLPKVLCWIQIVTGVLFALTVWIGPISGPFSFLGMLFWSFWLGIFLLRMKRTA
jgi:hypothetical protein